MKRQVNPVPDLGSRIRGFARASKASKACPLIAIVLARGVAGAEPCADAVADPTPTPVRDAGLDAQRSACLRDEVSATLNTHALIDTPGFHGVLGGDLALGGRFAWKRFEFGGRVRVVDYAFVQTAVTKATETRLGPVGISAAYGDRLSERAVFAVVLVGELPYTRDDMATVRAAGELAVAVTGQLSERWLLHARFGVIGATATSDGGTARQLGLRAGTDVAWWARRRISLHAGLESQAGWNGGLDAVMLRAGVQFRPTCRWRGRVGIGVPRGGNERTTAIVELGIARDL